MSPTYGSPPKHRQQHERLCYLPWIPPPFSTVDLPLFFLKCRPASSSFPPSLFPGFFSTIHFTATLVSKGVSTSSADACSRSSHLRSLRFQPSDGFPSLGRGRLSPRSPANGVRSWWGRTPGAILSAKRRRLLLKSGRSAAYADVEKGHEAGQHPQL